MMLKNAKSPSTGVKMDTLLQLSSGCFALKRLPLRETELLRAWDAADEYVLEYVTAQFQSATPVRVLIFNDSFGALALGLNHWQPTLISDSYLSQQATRLNFAANKVSENNVSLLNSLQQPNGIFDLVIIKVPKTLAYLEDFLIRLQPFITPNTQIIAAGMIKSLPASVWTLLERLIGKTTTSLAKKKARLIFAIPNPERVIPENPYPVCYRLENTHYQICNHANVFSRDSLDIGTRFLLAHLPIITQAREIVDLGCGNGIVGLLLAEKHPSATVHFVDESFMAVASAQQNFYQAFATQREGKFYVSDGLTEFASDSMDLIVCNPPFHQQQTVGDQIALSMFKQARRVLKKSGQFWVIGNRHLGYLHTLKNLFAQAAVVAANPKFVIIKASH
jgi:23S rRNA (guanine1835-N2)-methyltransferase